MVMVKSTMVMVKSTMVMVKSTHCQDLITRDFSLYSSVSDLVFEGISTVLQ